MIKKIIKNLFVRMYSIFEIFFAISLAYIYKENHYVLFYLGIGILLIEIAYRYYLEYKSNSDNLNFNSWKNKNSSTDKLRNKTYKPQRKKNKKTCSFCGDIINPKEGKQIYGSLVHKKCKPFVKRTPWRLRND